LRKNATGNYTELWEKEKRGHHEPFACGREGGGKSSWLSFGRRRTGKIKRQNIEEKEKDTGELGGE